MMWTNVFEKAARTARSSELVSQWEKLYSLGARHAIVFLLLLPVENCQEALTTLLALYKSKDELPEAQCGKTTEATTM